MNIEELIEKAIIAREKSYSPYSGFKVGAALETIDGEIYTGCNIENASYTPTNCAERTAFLKAVSEGKKEFKRIVIVGGENGKIKDFCPPCGVCLQVMNEFCDKDFEIVLAVDKEKYKKYKLSEMLPHGFRL